MLYRDKNYESISRTLSSNFARIVSEINLSFSKTNDFISFFWDEDMRGGVQLIVAVSLALLLSEPGEATSFRCSDRTPEGRITPRATAGNKFQIKISGNPSTFEPGEKYTGESFFNKCSEFNNTSWLVSFFILSWKNL